MTDNFRAIAGIAAIAITVLAAPLAANVKHANMARAEAAQKTATIQQPAAQVKSEPAPQVAAPIEPPKPALLAVTSPHGRVSVEQINTAVTLASAWCYQAWRCIPNWQLYCRELPTAA